MGDRQLQGSSHWYDPMSGATILNESAVSSDAVMSALSEQHPEFASLIRWSVDSHPRRSEGIFDRDRYVTPINIFDQMKVAYEALQSDDVVSGVLDTTESLAFAKMDFEADDPDEEDIWNQIAADLDLDSRLREIWRELFCYSQAYVCEWWGTKTYKVGRVVPSQSKRKKTPVRLKVPISLTLLDPLKVVPVGNLMFGRERLAYHATEVERDQFRDVLSGDNLDDLTVLQLIDRPYEPDQLERKQLGDLNIDPNNLFLLNEQRVWRHTVTRASYERFASVRMRAIFELLDLKAQLKQMDRAYLIGGTNFIILVKKGSDELPAKPQEISALASQVKMAARVPIIVGDHRLSVEIITPKTDLTLNAERYNTLDTRIEARLFQMFMTGRSGGGAKGDDSIKVARVVARGLESRRHMMRRSLEGNLVRKIYEANEDVFASGPAKLVFHPKRVALDFDPAVATFLQDLRDRGDISRETVLDEMDYSQYDEARKRLREKDFFDGIFKTTIPFSGPLGGNPATDDPAEAPITKEQKRTAGRTGGGNRNGGGSNPDSKTPNSSPVRPRKGDNG